MILNRCRRCGCPLDPGERYCDECEEEAPEQREAANYGIRITVENPDNGRKGEKYK